MLNRLESKENNGLSTEQDTPDSVLPLILTIDIPTKTRVKLELAIESAKIFLDDSKNANLDKIKIYDYLRLLRQVVNHEERQIDTDSEDFLQKAVEKNDRNLKLIAKQKKSSHRYNTCIKLFLMLVMLSGLSLHIMPFVGESYSFDGLTAFFVLLEILTCSGFVLSFGILLKNINNCIVESRKEEISSIETVAVQFHNAIEEIQGLQSVSMSSHHVINVLTESNICSRGYARLSIYEEDADYADFFQEQPSAESSINSVSNNETAVSLVRNSA